MNIRSLRSFQVKHVPCSAGLLDNVEIENKLVLSRGTLASGSADNLLKIMATDKTLVLTFALQNEGESISFNSFFNLQASRTGLFHAKPVSIVTNAYGEVKSQTSLTIVYSRGESGPGRKA